MSLFIEALELSGAMSLGFGIKSFWEWRKEKNRKKNVKPSSKIPKRPEVLFTDDLEQITPLDKDIYEWGNCLTCSVCHACNMHNSEEHNKRTSTKHLGCSSCDKLSIPHIHVECWYCKYKFIMVRGSS